MHGLVFSEFEKFVRTKFQGISWKDLQKQSGIEPTIYMYIRSYPDQDLTAILSVLSRVTQRTVPDLLEEFGKFIVPPLIETYGSIIRPEWKFIDVMENVEKQIHRVIRSRDPAATPPAILCRRSALNEVIIQYGSPRKMCAFAKGLVMGFAKHYNENVAISETSCMLENGSECILVIRVAN